MEILFFVLGSAVFVFVIIKIVFSFLAWVFPEADKTYRSQLDATFILLDTYSIFSLGRAVLVKILRPVRKFFAGRLVGYIIVVAFSLILNSVVFVLASTLVIASHFWLFSWGVQATIVSIQKAGISNFFGMNVLVGLLGATFDLLSLIVTLHLLTRASLAKTTRSLVTHLGIDFLIAAISCMWAYGIIDTTIRLYYDQMLPHIAAYSGGHPEIYIGITLWETLQVNPGMWYVVILLGVSAALPTLAYLFTLLPVLLLRITPRFIQRGMARVIYLITTDSQPVLKQLATFAGGIGALVGATVAWIKISPI